jgi:hypothetical protein
MVQDTIANMALTHLGVAATINSLNTDQSQEAKIMKLWYPIALEEILGDSRWDFATRYEPLSLIEENPTNEWKYSYRYPSNAVFIRRLLRDTGYIGNYAYRYTTGDHDIEFVVLGDDTSRIIYTDQENAVIEFTKKIETMGTVPMKFKIALSYLLAFYAAPKLSKSDSGKLADSMYAKYKLKVGEAQALNFNQSKFKEEDHRSSIERAREGL